MLLKCPACDRTTEHLFLYEKNACRVLQCTVCDLGRAEATGFDPNNYYTGGYFSGERADGYVNYQESEPVLRREFAHSVKFIRKYRAGGRLLDIGCAYGFFLDEARRYYDVAGIEIAQEAAAFCRQRGLRVLDGVANECNLAQLGQMDVIVLLDVIEHLPDPRETLALCQRHLVPGGIIAITTGDFNSMYARFSGARWRLMTPPQHLWYFTPKSVNEMSRSLGMRMEACQHPWKIVPLSLILFQAGRILGLTSAGGSGWSRIGFPVNLFDAMRIVLRKD